LPFTPTTLDDLLLLHQLGQHAQPDIDSAGKQSLLRCPNKLSQRLLHTLRQNNHFPARLRERYVPVHGGSSFDRGRIASNAPNTGGRDGGTAVYEVLRATGQPRNADAAGSVSGANLAAAMNVSRQTIYSIEQKRYTPSLPLALARFFGSTVEELFNAND
jgi:putative transcriptional regulator